MGLGNNVCSSRILKIRSPQTAFSWQFRFGRCLGQQEKGGGRGGGLDGCMGVFVGREVWGEGAFGLLCFVRK